MTFRLILVLTCSLTLISLTFYLCQVESAVRESYLIGQYKEKLRVFSEEKVTLEQERGRSFSLEKAENSIQTLGFIKISEVKHIPLPAESFYLVRE